MSWRKAVPRPKWLSYPQPRKWRVLYGPLEHALRKPVSCGPEQTRGLRFCRGTLAPAPAVDVRSGLRRHWPERHPTGARARSRKRSLPTVSHTILHARTVAWTSTSLSMGCSTSQPEYSSIQSHRPPPGVCGGEEDTSLNIAVPWSAKFPTGRHQPLNPAPFPYRRMCPCPVSCPDAWCATTPPCSDPPIAYRVAATEDG